jgi:hypothetical protein
MPILIHRLPFGPVPTGSMLQVPLGDPLPLLVDRIVLWFSITAFMETGFPVESSLFPGIFDSGFNNDFLIQKSQLISWTRQGTYEHCEPNGLFLRTDGGPIPLYDAAVWLYPNRPGTREVLTGGTPFCLNLPTGIAVTQRDSRNEKSWPLLGLSAIRFNDMRVHIDGKNETVTIEVP